MKSWVVLLAVGIIAMATGGAMVGLGWHHTVGLGGLWLGVVLVLGGLVLGRNDIKAGDFGIAVPSGQRSGLRKALLALVVVVVIGIVAFYGAAYLASNQPGGSTLTSSTNSQSSLSSSVIGSQTSSQSIASSSTTTTTSTTTSSSGPITLATVSLSAGTATNASSQGTAALYLVLQNSGPATTISSVEVSSLILPTSVTYQCSSSTSCSPISSPVVSANSNADFTSSTTGFYIGAHLVGNLRYLYQITFADGEVLSGSVTTSP
jgi:hypothetical protein